METKRRNRYGVEYWFQAVGNNEYTLEGNFDPYWRYGGQEGAETIDYNDLGFVDPSGGPFVSVGGYIENNKIVKIRLVNEKVYVKVDPNV